MVGMAGFEPATSWSRTKRATSLRYIPTEFYYNHIFRFCKNHPEKSKIKSTCIFFRQDL